MLPDVSVFASTLPGLARTHTGVRNFRAQGASDAVSETSCLHAGEHCRDLKLIQRAEHRLFATWRNDSRDPDTNRSAINCRRLTETACDVTKCARD